VETVRIMGIDPGLATLGYGIIDKCGPKLTLVDYGVVTTAAGLPLPRRLTILHDDVTALLQQYRPACVALEELFFARNVTTALLVGHARGAALVACSREVDDSNLFEYTPMQVKQAICGYGHADKKQVQQMVSVVLGMKHIPKPDDAADALAIAICHSNFMTAASQFRIT